MRPSRLRPALAHPHPMLAAFRAAPWDGAAARRFAGAFALAVLALLGAWLALAAALDPYDILGTRIIVTRELGADRRLAAPEGDRALGALHLAHRVRPLETVVVGSSRAMMGFDPDSATLAPLHAFNAGLTSLGFEESLAVLAYAIAKRPTLRRAIWLLDFDLFFLSPELPFDFGQSAFAGRPLVEAYSRYLLSTSAVRASLAVLRGAESRSRWAKSRRGLLGGAFLERDGDGQRRLFEQEAARLHPQLLRERDRFTADLGRHAAAFRAALVAARAAGVEVLVTLAPIQVWRRALFERAELAPAFEAWKRRLAAEVEAANAGPGSARAQLWDFARLHPLTAEPPPTRPGDAPVRHFWEGSHFRPSVGEAMAARMLPELHAPVDPSFGVVLTPDNVGEALDRDAAALAAWRRTHPQMEEDLAALLARPAEAAAKRP